MRRIIGTLLVFVTSVFMTFSPAFSQDAADDVVYNDGWQNGDNGGSGFGAWQLQAINNATFFISNSKTNGNNNDTNGDNDINTGINNDEAWGMFANGSNSEGNAIRHFNSPLTTGQFFTIFMDNGYINSGGSVGFGLQNSSTENLVEFFFQGGDTQYEVNDLNGISGTGISFTDEGLKLVFALTDNDSYQLTIIKLNINHPTVITGDLKNPAGGQTISKLRLFNFNGGDGASNNSYFNSIGFTNDATAPEVELNTVTGLPLVADATITDANGIVKVSVQTLSDALLTIGGNSASQGDTKLFSPTTSLNVSVTDDGTDPRVTLIITDVAGNERVWFFDFLNQ